MNRDDHSNRLEEVRAKLLDAVDEEFLDEYLSKKQMDEETEKLIVTALKSNIMGNSLTAAEMRVLMKELQYYKFEPGDIVCKQGAIGSNFFIIDSGEFAVLIDNEEVNRMTKSKAFGEIALLYNTARSATVKCIIAGGIWGVNRIVFRGILEDSSKRNYVENKAFVNNIPLFEMLTESQKSMVANALVTQTFQTNQAIINEGEKGEYLYMIKEGSAQVYINNKFVRKIKKGDFFGERALLYDEPRSASIIATCETICVGIARGMLTKIIGNLQHVLYQNIIMNSLQSSNVFCQFTENQLKGIVKNAQIKKYPENYTIIDRESKSQGVRYIIILEGTSLLSLDGKKVCRLTRGEAFGDEYIVHPNNPFMHRVDSITATTVAFLLNQHIYSNINFSDISNTLEMNNKAAIMSKIYIFKYLSSAQKEFLVNSFVNCTYSSGEVIFKQNDIGTSFYIIKQGEVEILRDNKRIRLLNKNDYFGERALLYEEPRSATVVCLTDTVQLWVVDKAVFLQIIQGPMLKHLEERIKLQDYKIALADLQVVRTIGRGAFGIVKKVKDSKNNSMFALKCISRSAIVKFKQQDNINYEREIMAENDHPFILKLVKTFKDSKYLYFLLELCTGGELYDAIRILNILNRSQAQFYITSIIICIEYLHEKSIAFRDLKPENILLDNQGYIKLIDFGCAKKVIARTYTVIGTPHYMAPEVIVGKGYSTTCDIWTFGVMLYEFLCGPLPFGSRATDQLEVYREILMGPLVFTPNLSDADAKNFIQKLLCRIPEIRIGCNIKGYQEIKSNKFFSDFNWEHLINREIEPPLIPEQELYTAAEAESNVLDDLYDQDEINQEGDLVGWDAEF